MTRPANSVISDFNFLIVEDHDFQRSMLVRMLTALGARSVREASDGHTALKMIQGGSTPVDIVVSDLEMPGMDGMEFIRRLGESGARVAIILASALESKLINSVAIMTGVYGLDLLGVVEKPLSPAKLEALVERYRRPQADESSRAGASAVAATRVAAFSLEEVATGVSADQIQLFLQPKVELATGQVKGAEALARWRHPLKGIILPSQFVKQLENCGLIDELTWLMLGKAAAFWSEQRAAGVDATVSVNLSLTSLADRHLADRVTQIVRERNLEPRHMVLEVTESATTTHLGRVLENLARLRMNGFGLSIDDYGTGYSSMQQLVRIPFSELKIDQSFVTNAAQRESSRVMLESSLELARKLGITSVAEGVESQEDLDLLRSLGCDLAQGYFIARPMHADAFPGWLRTRTWP
jgi:EAL domain-containing protein (putative c-di-GMP-specific phosphodiesterase class I)/AmiR/NasT family two-component response regulator